MTVPAEGRRARRPERGARSNKQQAASSKQLGRAPHRSTSISAAEKRSRRVRGPGLQRGRRRRARRHHVRAVAPPSLATASRRNGTIRPATVPSSPRSISPRTPGTNIAKIFRLPAWHSVREAVSWRSFVFSMQHCWKRSLTKVWAPNGEPLVAIVVGGGCLVVEPALGKKMKIIFSQCLTRVRCTPIIVSSLRRGARVAKGGRL